MVIETPANPLRIDERGVIRIAGTRVTLESIMADYDRGLTPEEIHEDFDSVSLAQIHAIISYYLDHQEQVRQYLNEREAAFEKSRKHWEAIYPPDEIRERLLARQKHAKG